MRQIQDYIGTPFCVSGRAYPNFDCWGLARDAAYNLFDLPLLPSFESINPSSKRSLTHATESLVVDNLIKVSCPVAGAFATGWFNGLCLHVGIVVQVDGRLWVLDTEEGFGGRLNTLEKFAQPYTEVIYYVAT